MIKLTDLLTEQNTYTKTMFDWLNNFKTDFMKKSAKMGFLPSSNYAINQLEGPSGNKDGIISVINYIVGRGVFFNTVTGDAQPKLKNNKKQLASSISQNTIALNKRNNVYFDFTPYGNRGLVDKQQYMNQSTKWDKGYFGNPIVTMVGSINAINQIAFRTKRPQIIFIAPADKPVNGIPYNKITMGTSDKLHLYSTREVATKTVPGTKATPDKVIDKPGQRFQPLIIPGTNFRSNSAQFTDPAEVIALITQRIQQMRDANISIPDGVGTVIINSGTDSMPSNYGGRGNQGLADDRGATLQRILQDRFGITSQIVTRGFVNAIPPGTTSWGNKPASQTRQQWMDAAQPARMVRLTFPSVQAPDEEEIIKGKKGTPPTKVDTPKKVTINHLEVFIKK